MKFTEEQLKKMNAAKTAEELIALAKAEGIEASEEEIKVQFAAMHTEGEIANDELDNVAGGACGHSYVTYLNCSCQRFKNGHNYVKIDGYYTGSVTCPFCGNMAVVDSVFDVTTGYDVYSN